MWRILAVFSILLLGYAGGNAQKQPFTIADLYKIVTVDEPSFSPDGSRIVFTVREDTLAKGKSNTEIYVIQSDGTGLRRMTENPSTDNAPRWSRNGKSILFTSSRGGSQQAWLLPMDGGEPRKLTELSYGIDDPQWVDDGRRFMFKTDVFPEYGADDALFKKADEGMNNGPIQAHMADRLLYRHWNEYKDGKKTHTLLFDVSKKSVLDLTPGDFDAPTFSLGGGGYAVSPDGKEVCIVSNHDAHEAESTNSDLWIVPSGGGMPTNITADNRAFDGSPVYSPDGRYIAYRMQTVPAYESDRFRIALYDRDSKSRIVLTEKFDNWITDMKWAPDSHSVYFLAEVEGHVPLYNIDIRTKRVMRVVDAQTIDAFDVNHDGSAIVFVHRSVAEPCELWRVDAGGKNLRRLTFFNKALADSVDIRPAEELWISSPTGYRIHTFVVKPHNFDPSHRYPLILNVHGGPQSQWADAFRGDWQVYPGAGYIVAFPNPTGSTGYGQSFTADISKDWSGRVYQDLMAVTDSLAKLPYVDADRMGAMGWSYGGYMMMWLEGHTDRFKAIGCMMGVYNLTAMHGATEELWFPQWDLAGLPWNSDLYTTLSPNRYVMNFKTPCLVITGERDYRVPYTQSLEFFTDLQQMNVPSRLIVFKNDGHWPSGVKSMPLYYNAHLDWFHRYLGGGPAPYDMTKMLRNQVFE